MDYVSAETYTADRATSEARAAFIRRTYAHLGGAILAFALLEYVLLQTPLAELMIQIIAASRFGWLMFLGAFILCGWMARGLASSAASVQMQYLGLGLYVVAEAIIFVPLLYMATTLSSPTVLPTAAILTAALFTGLTAVVFITRKDFSFMGGILSIGGFIAIGLIVCAALFGINLGLFFSVAMVGLAGIAILYDTSKILHNYSTDQHVAASLELFASVALLFWYVLRIVMRFSRD